MVIAQNRYDAECRLELTLITKSGRDAIEGNFPALCINTAPSAVVLAQYDVLLAPSRDHRRIAIKPNGNCVRIGDGKLVRFARRSVLQTETKPWVTALAAMSGVIAFGGARLWEFELMSTARAESCDTDLKWRRSDLWTPLSPTTIDNLVEILKQNMNRKNRGST
jgi:hypothetical protein